MADGSKYFGQLCSYIPKAKAGDEVPESLAGCRLEGDNFIVENLQEVDETLRSNIYKVRNGFGISIFTDN